MQELEVFLRASPGETRQTAGIFLQFMTKMKEVVLQDAAAMLILHPDRSVHQLFQMSVFRSDSFKAYVEVMRRELAAARDPADVTLQAVIPSVAERLNVLHQQVERNLQAIDAGRGEVCDAVLQGVDAVASEIRTLALPINQMAQSQLNDQGNVDTSASIMAACNAYANDYSKRMEHRRQALRQHQALLFPTTTTTMGVPQQIVENSSPS
ncbi:hypothetical protein IV203_023844 [Nitzschia inconspicua]|uniref:Uncharacterized protein n=1 Tax=Nitzschia inconspicua TaxID=303405 RepID=A0A9K3PB34_9STRA|nr:hypothetical protein IV203_023844 [Nitzschia inconspicua]